MFAKIGAMCVAHGVGAFGALVRGVVVEHDVGMVHRVDRVDVLRVPRVVVALDQLVTRCSSSDCPTPAEHALVADAPCQAVGVEALEEELRRLAADAEQVAEPRERDAAVRLELRDECGARVRVRRRRDRVAVADADEAAPLLEEAGERLRRRP